MISLEQVLLLQKKVETAVEKIASLSNQVKQLNSDNDALRSKCAELTKALSDKSELVTSLESDQTKIEQGILNALSRLDTVENAVLSGSSQSYNKIFPESVAAEEFQSKDVETSVENNKGAAEPTLNTESLSGNFDIY